MIEKVQFPTLDAFGENVVLGINTLQWYYHKKWFKNQTHSYLFLKKLRRYEYEYENKYEYEYEFEQRNFTFKTLVFSNLT